MLTLESFLADIESFCDRAGMSATAFGKAAVGDPNLVGDMKSGRMPGLRLIERVRKFIADYERPAPTRQAARVRA